MFLAHVFGNPRVLVEFRAGLAGAGWPASAGRLPAIALLFSTPLQRKSKKFCTPANGTRGVRKVDGHVLPPTILPKVLILSKFLIGSCNRKCTCHFEASRPRPEPALARPVRQANYPVFYRIVFKIFLHTHVFLHKALINLQKPWCF